MRWSKVVVCTAAGAFLLAGCGADPVSHGSSGHLRPSSAGNHLTSAVAISDLRTSTARPGYAAGSVTLASSKALTAEKSSGPAPAPAPASSPLARTHAHNDYLHAHPLFDALSHRFLSVEADIWLADDGSLLVGHTKSALQHDQTIEALYLDPLMQLAATNGGHVYADSNATVQLLVDVKSSGTATYAALDRQLRTHYRSLLTSWAGGVEHRGAVTVVISGNRDRPLMESQPVRYAAYDGRLSDLGAGAPATFIPLISANWSSVFKWKGTGSMPSSERAQLHAIVNTAHADHQQVRFWNTPDRSASQRLDVWREELAADVDWLNTDELGALEDYLATHDTAAPRDLSRYIVFENHARPWSVDYVH